MPPPPSLDWFSFKEEKNTDYYIGLGWMAVIIAVFAPLLIVLLPFYLLGRVVDYFFGDIYP